MQRSPLIAASIAVACVIVLASLTNVVGVQTVETTNHAAVKDEVDTKELLFQTIIDIANDKEIQNIIQKYDERTSVRGLLQGNLLGMNLRMHGRELSSPSPVLTKAFLEFAYIMGARLVRLHDASWMRLTMERYRTSNQRLQQEITAGIENNSVLANELSELLEVPCDCEKGNALVWHPILCLLFFPIAFVIIELWAIYAIIGHYVPPLLDKLMVIINNIGISLNCFW